MHTELQTARLLLRPVTAADADAVFIYSGDAELTRYMIFFPKDSTDEVRRFLEQAETEWKKDTPNYFEFAVMLENELIGGVSLWLSEDRSEGELGWLFRREYHGKGYAFEAVKVLCRFAFETLSLKRLVAQCDARNTPSEKLMLKLGMTLLDNKGRAHLPEASGDRAGTDLYSGKQRKIAVQKRTTGRRVPLPV